MLRKICLTMVWSVLALTVSGAALVMFAGPPLVAGRLLDALEDAGFPVASVDHILVTPWCVDIKGLNLTRSASVSDIHIHFTPIDLIHKRVRRVEMSGANVTVDISADGTMSIEGRMPSQAAATPFDPPLIEAVLRDLRLHLRTKVMEVIFLADGKLRRTQGDILKLIADITARDPSLEGNAQLALRLMPDGAMTGSMEISELDIKTPALHLQGLAGWGTMERSPSGSMTATAGAESSVVRVLGIEAPTAIASYSLDDASMTASIRAGAEGTGRLSFDADLLRATRQLTLQMAATGTDLGDISGVPDLGGALYVDLAGLLPDAADIDPLSLTGRIKADMTGLAVPGVVSDGTLRLRALLDIGEDGLTITPDEVVTLEGDLPSFFAESIGAARGQWRLDATKTGSARFVFGSGPEMAVSGRVSIASDNQELAGAVLDDVRIQKNVSGVWTLGGQVRDMSTAPLAFDRARFDVENGHVKISGSPDDLTLTGRIGAHLHGWVRDVAGFRNLRLALSGTVRRTGDDLSYHGDGCQMIDAASIRSKDWMLLLPKGVCLKPEGDTPMIAVGPDGIMADLNVRSDPFALRQVKADNPVALSGALPDIRLIFSPSDLSVSLKGGKIGIKDGVRAEDIGGALTIGDDVDVSMNIAKLMVPGLVPLSAAIGAKGALGELLSVTARVAGAGGALIVASEGSVDPLAGVGTLSATLHPVVFTRGVRAPADLVPALKGIVTDGSGTVAGSAKLSLSPSGMTSEGVLSLRDLTLAKDGMIARGIDGEIRFCDLIPLRSPAGQKLAIDEIVAGVRLTDGSVSFGIEEGPVLAVSRTFWHWAGGMLATEPMTITKGAPVSVTLKAADLDLPQVLELAKIKGLASTGLLAGKLPLRVFEGRMEIDGGKLYSLGGGHLSYDPNDPPAFLKEGAGAHMNILRDALRNLDYESLRITIDGATDGEQKVIMTVRGVNPDFFDGRPVSLTINLSGALHSVVSRGLGTGTVGKDIRQQFEMIEER